MHGIQLKRVPTDGTLSATRLFVDVLLGTVRTRVCSISVEGGRVKSPVLVRHAIPAGRPVESRIHGNGGVSGEIRVSGVPRPGRGRGLRRGQGKAAVVHGEEIDQILCRLVKA